MKIAIYGAGAIGGYMAARLARTDAEVVLIARGAKLEAIRRNGLRLFSDREDFTVSVACTDDPAEAGVQDYVVLAMKAHSIPAVAPLLRPMLGPQTAVVPAVNGVPWWFFYRLGGAWDGQRLESLDPGGAQWTHIGPERVIGCVVYPAAEVLEPGVVRHISLDRMPVGEPDGARSERAGALSRAMAAAGMRAPVRPRIRDDIWIKLWGNATFNPVSLLTGATLEEIAGDDSVRAGVRQMMIEVEDIGKRLGLRLSVDLDRRLAGAGAVGAHKTSTLQDLENGRTVELVPLIGAVIEIGRKIGAPTPTLDLIYALARQRARTAGVWPD